MEQIIILDHGYVRHVESYGRGDAGVAEAGIIEAARQSTQGSFRGWDLDQKLLATLFNNVPQHATPFEFAGMTIEVQAPIFVFREWHRHRTQCLVGSTQITCVSPRGTTFKRTIKEIFDLKHGGVIDTRPARHKNGKTKAGTLATREARHKDPWRARVLPNCQTRILRVLNEETGEFETAPMAKVWEAGVKPVYALITANGRVVQASAEHPFYTRRGWVKLRDIVVGDEVARMGKVAAHASPIPPKLRQGIGVWTTMMRTRIIKDVDHCYLCRRELSKTDLELDHVIPVVENLQRALDPTNLKPVCVRCHRNKTDAEQPSREGMSRRGIKWERITELPRAIGNEMTYDIEVEGPHHNYLANDLVVHNSYNEMSARYAPLPDLNYIPTVERLLMGVSTTNKQAGVVKGAGELDLEGALSFQRELKELYDQQEAFYQKSLLMGVPKELARIDLPVGRYSRMRAHTSLRNWLAFLTLRSDPGAQWEIRQFAEAVEDIIRIEFPQVHRLFDLKRASR